MSFPSFRQLDAMDCGPTCLRMIAKHYGKNFSTQTLRNNSNIGRLGVSLLGIAEGAESIGFHTLGVSINIAELTESPLPLIAHWNQRHFVVVYRITKKTIYVSDPAAGLLEYDYKEFSKSWATSIVEDRSTGTALFLEPTQNFFSAEDDETVDDQALGFVRILRYVKPYYKMFLQVLLSLLISSTLQLAFPFLTKTIIDKGINLKDLNYITIILIAQLVLIIGRATAEYLRSWLLLHISARVNLSIVYDFLFKLMKLPLSFFEIKMFGDIVRRIEDHSRIQSFITSHSLELIFSFANFIVLGFVLFRFNTAIFLIFFILSLAYLFWIIAFLNQRRKNDYKQFNLSAKESSLLLQTIQGMPDIKMANAETSSRWQWEKLQSKIFKINISTLTLAQYQQAGGLLINEGKNILITFLSAKSVINGDISLGAMLAIQQIIGQLNAPMEQIIGFTHQLQDTRISLERLNEIHKIEDEELGHALVSEEHYTSDIHINDVTFTYPGAGLTPVIQDLTLTVLNGKTTAIVGSSGSGKTTLLKLLLKFYHPDKGTINLGNKNIQNISHKQWRMISGIVMQDGFIFSDTIASNIAIGEESIDNNKLTEALTISNLVEYVDSLPLGINTIIGAQGNGLSQGQKQRVLIARAVYKQPRFLFFDEATNSLDTNNERIIVNNLTKFFKDRTVVVVAHRLSTVMNADRIIVMDEGRIVEIGNNESLIKLKGKYYELIKNQLELGN